MNITMLLLFLAITPINKKEEKKPEKRDYGDKQLLQRDVCRKPIEALETKYSDLTKEQLEKMKAKCSY